MTINYHQHLEQEKSTIQSIVEFGYRTIYHQYTLVQDGVIDLTTAKVQALKEIQRFRYKGSQYLWINDFDGTLIAHGDRPDFVGMKLQSFTRNDTGEQIFAQYDAWTADARKNHGAYIRYTWNPNKGFTSEKISYIKPFESWGWFIGSGIDLEKIRRLAIGDELPIWISLSILNFCICFIYVLYNRRYLLTRKRRLQLNR